MTESRGTGKTSRGATVRAEVQRRPRCMRKTGTDMSLLEHFTGFILSTHPGSISGTVCHVRSSVVRSVQQSQMRGFGRPIKRGRNRDNDTSVPLAAGFKRPRRAGRFSAGGRPPFTPLPPPPQLPAPSTWNTGTAAQGQQFGSALFGAPAHAAASAPHVGGTVFGGGVVSGQGVGTRGRVSASGACGCVGASAGAGAGAGAATSVGLSTSAIACSSTAAGAGAGAATKPSATSTSLALIPWKDPRVSPTTHASWELAQRLSAVMRSDTDTDMGSIPSAMGDEPRGGFCVVETTLPSQRVLVRTQTGGRFHVDVDERTTGADILHVVSNVRSW